MGWFKFYGKDFLVDPKVRNLSSIHQLMFVYLLCYASNNENGTVEYLTEWQLAMNCGITETSDQADDVDGCFDALERLNMISREGKNITVLKYEERQNTQLTGAERAKKYRDKQRDSDERNAGNVTKVTLDKKRVEESRGEKKTDQKNTMSAPELADRSGFEQFWNAYPKKELKQRLPTPYFGLRIRNKAQFDGDVGRAAPSAGKRREKRRRLVPA
jgi:hypothetical protein